MASRRALKKSIFYIAEGVMFVAMVDKIDRNVISEAIQNILNLIPRISHTEPGNAKLYYKKLKEELSNELTKVSVALENVEKA